MNEILLWMLNKDDDLKERALAQGARFNEDELSESSKASM